MTNHADIFQRFTGPADLARVSGMTSGAAKQAIRRGSISPGYWAAIVASGKATLQELANAAAARKQEAARRRAIVRDFVLAEAAARKQGAA